MSKREKLLAMLVGLMLLVVGGVLGGSKVNKMFRARRNALVDVEGRLDAQQLTIQRGTAASRVMADYEARSLSSDLELAQSQYEGWIFDLLEKHDFSDGKCDCQSRPDRIETKPATITWKVSGLGEYDQVIALLKEYYSLDVLHRMSSLNVKKLKDTRDLQLRFTTQAFSLAYADPKQKLDIERVSPWAESFDEAIVDRILQRNVFSPANNPPQIAKLSEKKVIVGKTLEVSIKGSDPDELDSLTYSLVQPEEGAKINPKTGAFEWKPKDEGEFMFVALVEDDGIPSQSHMQEFMVKVNPPPPPPEPKPEPKPDPPPPKVDEAMYTHFSGQVKVNGEAEIWLKIRTTGERLKLVEGDSVKVGSIDGIVSKINDRSFELKVGDETREIRRGQPLVPRAAKATPSEEATADEQEPATPSEKSTAGA